MSETFEEYFKKTWSTSGAFEELDTTIEQDIWNHQEKKLQAEREKVALLREAVSELLFHCRDYGLEEESLVILMACEKTRQALEKLKELEGEG